MQEHVEVDVTAHFVYEVVTTDGEAVAVAADLPNGHLRVGGFETGGNSTTTAVDGVEAVGIHIVRQTRATSDARDNGSVVWGYAYFSHCLMKGGENEVVATTGAPAY